jgi:hypothetical protein
MTDSNVPEIRQCYHLKHQDSHQNYIGCLDHQGNPLFACTHKCAISTLRSSLSKTSIADVVSNLYWSGPDAVSDVVYGLLTSVSALAKNCDSEPKPKKHALSKSNTIIWQRVKETR